LVPVDPAISPLGQLTVVGVDETDMAIDRNIYDIPSDPSQPTTIGGVADVMVLSGKVEGFEDSMSSLYLGQTGIFGFISIQHTGAQVEYWFDSSSENERAGLPFKQTVSISRSVVSPPIAISANGPTASPEAQAGEETIMDEIARLGDSITNVQPPSLEQITKLLDDVLNPLLTTLPNELPEPVAVPVEAAGPVLDAVATAQALATERGSEVIGSTLPVDVMAAAAVVCPSTYPTAKIWYMSTQGFVDSNPGSWYDRMVSASTTDRPAWSSVCINLAGKFGKTHDIVVGSSTHTSDDCDTAFAQYRTWLQTWKNSMWSLSTDQVGYQLWTAADLSAAGNTYKCFGVGAKNAVPWQSLTDVTSRKNQALLAASIVEGRDVNCCDAYDPSEVNQRAVVSGHELGHMFGEENHPSGYCSGWANMMADNGQLRQETRPCFVDSSKIEINNWFFSHAEP
jgi:hypothetical protein